VHVQVLRDKGRQAIHQNLKSTILLLMPLKMPNEDNLFLRMPIEDNLSETEIRNFAFAALLQLFSLFMLPDLIVDQSLASSRPAQTLIRSRRTQVLPQEAQLILKDIVTKFSEQQCLFLSCISWSFNVHTWDFYYAAFGSGDTLREHMEKAVVNYNVLSDSWGKTTTTEGLSRFEALKLDVEVRLVNEAYHPKIHQIANFPPSLPKTEQTYEERLRNHTYKFCITCMSDKRHDLTRPLLRLWFIREGRRSMIKSISLLNRMSSPQNVPSQAAKSNQLATIAFCGIVVEDTHRSTPLSRQDRDLRLKFIASLTRLGLIQGTGDENPDFVWNFLNNNSVQLELFRSEYPELSRASHVWLTPDTLWEQDTDISNDG